jgi:hypothetical protein
MLLISLIEHSRGCDDLIQGVMGRSNSTDLFPPHSVSRTCYVELCYGMLCYAMVCYVVVWCGMLWYVMV